MLLAQIIIFTWLLRRPLARAPYVVLFNLKPLIEDGNLQVCMYTVCMHEKEPQETPEHTSEVVKSQNCLKACPQTPLTQSILSGPTLPWAPPLQTSRRLWPHLCTKGSPRWALSTLYIVGVFFWNSVESCTQN